MPIISRESIEEIRSRVNLLDIVEPYVSLKRSGSSYKGLSPFNSEKTPSFYVHPDKGFYKCFSSGEGGDLFKFIQQVENLEFQEAVEHIANRFSIQLQYESGGPDKETRTLRANLFEIYEHACSYFHNVLLEDKPASANVRKYWKDDRAFSEKLAKEFKIGYAPPKDDGLLNLLRKQNYPDEALLKSGLFYGKDPSRLHLRFRGRLMIPIRDAQGRVIAFTARQTEWTPQDHDIEKSKYINSPETPIFIKKNMLFNLDRARVPAGNEGRFILVEGQLDALRLWDSGIENAVAPQGSGISEEQLIMLKRYASGLDCLLDGDRAGFDAAMRIIPMALKVGLFLRLIPLPEGSDPDDFLKKQGTDAFNELCDTACSPIEFAVKKLLPAPLKADTREKADVIRRCFEMVAASESSLARDDMLAEIGKFAYVDRASLQQDFDRYSKSGKQPEIQPRTANPQKSGELLTIVEEELLLLLLQNEEAGEYLSQHIAPEWITRDSVAGGLLNRFLAAYREDMWQGADNLGDLIETDEENNTVYQLLAHNAELEDPLASAHVGMRKLYSKFCDHHINELELRLHNADANAIDTLLKLQGEIRDWRNSKKNPPINDL